jgi:histidine triad (HIT) family protein
MTDCIFCKIAAGEFNTEFIAETDDYAAFNDLNPQAPVHVLVIPKKHSASLNETESKELLGTLLSGAKEVAEKTGIADGYRVVINTGREAGQTVFHLHLHVLGGREMNWPPG